MKSAPFDYLAPNSIDDAVEALVEYRGSAKVLAGGQSLVPMLGFRLVRPAALIDLRHITELTGISPVGDRVSIGAMTTHRSVEVHQELIGRCPMVAEALEVVGHVSIRNRGTVGGSMVHADPAAEWPTLALALDAKGVCTHARVGLGAVAPTPLLVDDGAKALIGTKVDDDALKALAAAASAACNPIDDKRGTVAYRIKVAGVLARRAAGIAYERATSRK